MSYTPHTAIVENFIYDDFFALKKNDLVEQSRVHDLPAGIHIANECMIPNLHFLHYTFGQPETWTQHFKSSHPYISLVFSLKNKCLYVDAESSNIFANINANQYRILYIANKNTTLEWDTEAEADIFIINLSLDYFKRFIPENHQLLVQLEKCTRQNQSAPLSYNNMEIAPKMLTMLYEISQCEYQQHSKTLFLKSRVIELLMHQLEQFSVAVSCITINDDTIEKMHLARSIIHENLSQSCSIIDLAQQIGTNDCYLKKHFKQVFGSTVYGYLQKSRMEKSRELLLEGSKKIAEIAKLTGYKNPSHFTAAFKKHFGYLPNKIRIIAASFFIDCEAIFTSEMLAFF